MTLPATRGRRTRPAREVIFAFATAGAAVMLLACGGGEDALTPTITLTAPADLADDLTGMLTLAAEAGDNIVVAGVEFQVDGVTVGDEDTKAPYALAIDTTAWASGQHVVRARARDAAGKRSAWVSARVRFGGSRGIPAGFTKNEAWVAGLARATAFAQAPDGRMFVAEQGGALRVVRNGTLLATPFLTRAVDDRGECGLIGVTLHPNFDVNGWVYVYYTRVAGGARNNRIARFTAAGDIAAGGEEVVRDLPDLSAATIHNGGALKFGAEGKLYVAVGDNGNGALAQDPGHLFGKMLRLNDDLSIPVDNPFYATRTGDARAIWASGLRNPFTVAVQAGSGRMHINDVGENAWEEIDLGVAGANYGWPASEGPSNPTAGMTAPLFSYRHSEAAPPGSGSGGFFTGRAITGGAFYPDSGPFPVGYRGHYFFADFIGAWIGVLDLANGDAAYTFGRLAGHPVDMLVGTEGELFVLTYNSVARITVP